VLTQDTLAFLEALNLQHLSLLEYSNGVLTAGNGPARSAFACLCIVCPTSCPQPGWGVLAWHRALREQSSTERVMTSLPFLPPGTSALTWPVEDLVTHLEARCLFSLPSRVPSQKARLWMRLDVLLTHSMVCSTQGCLSRGNQTPIRYTRLSLPMRENFLQFKQDAIFMKSCQTSASHG
jgi:hypothetical protein